MRLRGAWRAGVVAALVAAACCTVCTVARAQQPEPLDTTRVYEMEPVVVAADRSAQQLSTSVAAVSVVQAQEMSRLPVMGLADALQHTPGFTFLHLDGAGYQPQPVVRGFYGGGEAEYLVLLLNGRPLNEVERGLINWNLLSLAGIETVEVLRGGASSLYGDAAIGGVVNVVMRAPRQPVARVALEGGTYGTFGGQASAGGTWGGRAFTLFGSGETTEGFRDHAARTLGSAGGSLALVATPRATLSLSTLHHWQGYDEPGSLAGEAMAAERDASSPFYRFDRTDDRTHRAGLDGQLELSPSARLTAYVTGEVRRTERIGTLVLAPVFADTKARDVETRRLQGSVQATIDRLPLSGRLVAGADVSAAGLDTEYHGILLGGPDAYEEAAGAVRGPLQARGTGSRRMAAPFFQLDLYPVSPLRLTVGGRLDYLRDTFTPEAPAGAEAHAATHTAFSPKAGVNYRLVATARQVANVYANVSRSFKSATLDQLYDQRTIPFPDPESGQLFEVSLSNAALEPQFGTSYEAGLYHRAVLAPGASTELSLAVYRIDMRNELDFSLETLSYTNLGKSLHRGVEAGLKLHLPRQVTLFGNYTYQGVTLEYGANEGNYVKAIPRDAYSAGVSAAHRSGLGGSLVVSGAGRIFLDDANTLRLPGYARVDAKLAYRLGRYGVHAEVFNLLDEAYSTTGFPDPAGSGVIYYYPAAGRHVRLGVTMSTR